MYQEVQSSPRPRMPFTRRAIIVWNFHQAHDGEGNGTHWRYLDASPPRRLYMSPSPHASHHISASMSENFDNWAETPLLPHQNMLNLFVQGLVTPPNTADLQLPFDAQNFGYGGQSFDLPNENLSFALDGHTTLVDHNTVANIDYFLSAANAGLGDYDHNAASWAFPATLNFDANLAWANYSVPSSTPSIGWDCNAKGNHGWIDIPVSVADVKGKQMGWVEDEGGKHVWGTEVVGSSPVKLESYVQGIEQKLGAWIEEHESGGERGLW
jgi:transcriptional enhancer factor